MKKGLLLLLTAFTLSMTAQAQISAGSIMFVAFNGDGDDGVAFVPFVDIPAGTTIYFTDNEWTGAAFSTGESYWEWSSGSDLIAGNVVIIEDINQGTLSGASLDPVANIGTCTWSTTSAPDNNSDLDDMNEAVYMYLASSWDATPDLFITAIANSNFNPTTGELDGTGLTEGVNAVQLLGNFDVLIYESPLECGATIEECMLNFANPDNWATDHGPGDDSADGDFPDFPDDVPGYIVLPCNCDVPTGLTVSAITSYSATLSWTGVDGASGYVIQYENDLTGPNYRGKVGSEVTSINVGAGKIQPGNTYVWGVKTWCGSCYSDWSEPSYFTSPLRLAGNEEDVAFIFPNPSNGQLSVQLPVSTSDYLVVVTDLSGKMVLSQTVAAGESMTTLFIDTPGMYQVLISGNEASFVEKVIVQ